MKIQTVFNENIYYPRKHQSSSYHFRVDDFADLKPSVKLVSQFQRQAPNDIKRAQSQRNCLPQSQVLSPTTSKLPATENAHAGFNRLMNIVLVVERRARCARKSHQSGMRLVVSCLERDSRRAPSASRERQRRQVQRRSPIIPA